MTADERPGGFAGTDVVRLLLRGNPLPVVVAAQFHPGKLDLFLIAAAQQVTQVRVPAFPARAKLPAGELSPPKCAADLGLAELLRRHAATVPAQGDWVTSFRYLLTEALDDGTASLQEMAKSMAVSPRTLQRRLAECGTSWRAELDAVRRQRVRRGAPTMTALARDLGYTDPRSARRAVRRLRGPETVKPPPL